ncbi:MAG: hypothetical protein DWQ31_10125 [Planctomycetota bacterium]|nr:MAG: hypothetical protein DWQ31_10125 [Planctomycetota bacterium]REJ94636.1 MAG: hypothetical protein DWQ35_07855 [Planctomycetota bacterium]REK22613.1 MAG: hypothetical protein DWQ42_16865 [Planctomycetota bacterium]REK46595.1 MAG: hypothetical protein DWQ46_06910 [Planctomycetota bacterium]
MAAFFPERDDWPIVSRKRVAGSGGVFRRVRAGGTRRRLGDDASRWFFLCLLAEGLRATTSEAGSARPPASEVAKRTEDGVGSSPFAGRVLVPRTSAHRATTQRGRQAVGTAKLVVVRTGIVGGVLWCCPMDRQYVTNHFARSDS